MTHTWIDRARYRMAALGLSQEYLAEALGCSRGAVGHYLAGRRNPTLQQLETIAEVLALSPAWLLFGDDRAGVGEPAAAYGNGGGIPIRGTSDTGLGRRLLGRLDVPACCPDAYALVVNGAAWAPRIHDGEIVLLCPQREPEPGDEICVRYRSGETALHLLIGVQGEQVILDSLTEHRRRERKPRKTIRFMHPILGVFRAGIADLS